MAEKFPGYTSNITNYVREKLNGTIMRTYPMFNKDFIFIELVDNISIDIILKNCQKVFMQDEGEKLLNVAQV